MKELKIGHHLSISRGFPKMIEQANAWGMNIFSCMIGNPQTGNFKPRSNNEIAILNSALQRNIIKNFVVHCPYTFNLASKNEAVRERTIRDLKKILPYLDRFYNVYYVLHPGSHTGNGVDKGIELIAEGLNEVMYLDMTCTILLETMAGKGTEIGNLEHLSHIIEKLKYPEHIGICFDTCHTWDNGINLANFDEVVCEMKKLGIYDKIRLIHFNDSKNDKGAHKDRHENIGEGKIGATILKNILNYKDFLDMPFILETNREDDKRVIKEIEMLKKWREESV